VREQRVVLEHSVYVALGRRNARDIETGELDVTFVGLLEACDHPKRRCLAGTGGAEQREELAFGDVEVELVDRDDVAVRPANAAQPHRRTRCAALLR